MARIWINVWLIWIHMYVYIYIYLNGLRPHAADPCEFLEATPKNVQIDDLSSNLAKIDSKMAAKCPKLNPRGARLDPDGPKMAQNEPKRAPRLDQDGSKYPKMAQACQTSSNMGPDGKKEGGVRKGSPQDPPNEPRWLPWRHI